MLRTGKTLPLEVWCGRSRSLAGSSLRRGKPLLAKPDCYRGYEKPWLFLQKEISPCMRGGGLDGGDVQFVGEIFASFTLC
jgi:hypothetical protein